VAHLEKGGRGELPETPKAGDPIFDRTLNLLMGGNSLAVQAAAEEAKGLGYQVLVLSSQMEGEAREVARVYGAIAKEIQRRGHPLSPPACVLSGGETTVTLRGKGKGGRNQEFVLAAALEMAGLEGVAVLSGGTDGTDGPTDAAGAIADGQTVERAAEAGLNARAHLQNNDAYPFFERLGDLLITGPTLTNVMDLHLLLVG
jgi:hydroxypyruvate reductase